jgi:type I restriction enzyme S subunit
MSIWKTEPLGKVIRQMTTGSTPPTTQKEYFQGEIQWFTPGDIGATPYLSKSSRQISENAIRHGKAKLLKADTLLLTCIGDIGRVGILQVEASCNQQITALNFGNEIDSWFAYYWFVINQPRLTSFANQAVVPILNNSRLQEIEFSYPPLAEQQRIAGLLRRADRLRRLRRYALDVGAGYLQAVFVEMFGELTANPLGWTFNALGEVANIASGVTKGRDFKGKATITTPYLRVANVQDGFLDLSEIKMIEALPSMPQWVRTNHSFSSFTAIY